MTEVTSGSPPQSIHHQRRQAWFVLGLGVVTALAAVVLILVDRSDKAAPPVGLVEEAGVFPVTSLFGIDNTGTQPDAGHLAPNFAFHLPDGNTVSLVDYRGQPVVLNFWATWCGPCRLEMPELVAAYERYRDQGLVIIEVNTGEAHQPVAEFVEEFGMTMPVVIDPRYEAMSAYGTQALPASFFIDRDGIIQVRWIGFLDGSTLEENLEAILG